MTLDAVARIRRFNRAVTLEVGALDESFLGRGRPLGAARVLNAVGRGKNDVAALRACLKLDSGLASRLLRSLEEEGLVVTEPHADDARRRVVRLTAAGEAEFRVYEELSDARAAALLGRCRDADAVLAAMDLIAAVLESDRIAVTEVDPAGPEARFCLGRYYAELDERFEEGFQVGLSRDPDLDDMRRPRGTFLVALSEGMPLGCVGLKRSGERLAEIKRLWVDRTVRGLDLGRRLARTAEQVARELGIATLRLDTNRALTDAIAMYRRWGWTEIDRFNDDPYADYFFEKHIAGEDSAGP